MSGSLSDRVSSMKFMQVAGDRHRTIAKEEADSQKKKKMQDFSEWSLPMTSKTLKVLKSKSKRIPKVGYTNINTMLPRISKDINHQIIGRKTMDSSVEEIVKKPTLNSEDVRNHENREVTTKGKTEEEEKPKKSKKGKKSKKSKPMSDFQLKSDDEFDPTEVELSSKSLLDLWKAKKS
ncbi:uncharacterized protein C5L36_0B04860 [Pichia kudriavzevii]|uniref:Uncharacterized protein n=1 Tax=Pichia kudriavzevii TaxID=4909 RepID=A0A2U9R222_PICKU|nr:uncharacterized protein C5L36_0B04860 [Pichia kudriavzevii]AWU75236.1 hypothetical protein C5L36_0B04860 [Pichia kudriavzevii]